MKTALTKKWWLWTLAFIWVLKLSSAMAEGADQLVTMAVNLTVFTVLVFAIWWAVQKLKR